MNRSPPPFRQTPGGTHDDVEPAGTCADGDDCARWHCHTCGRYWLGDPAHACAAPGLEQRISTWMEQAVNGEDVATGARKVLERVKAAGLGEAFLDAYGPRLIEELWRARDGDDDHHQDQGNANGVANGVTNGMAKPSAAATQTSSFVAIRGQRLTAQMVSRNAAIKSRVGAPSLPKAHQVASVAANGHTAMPGPRRVDVEQLATRTALLESLFQRPKRGPSS